MSDSNIQTNQDPTKTQEPLPETPSQQVDVQTTGKTQQDVNNDKLPSLASENNPNQGIQSQDNKTTPISVVQGENLKVVQSAKPGAQTGYVQVETETDTNIQPTKAQQQVVPSHKEELEAQAPQAKNQQKVPQPQNENSPDGETNQQSDLVVVQEQTSPPIVQSVVQHAQSIQQDIDPKENGKVIAAPLEPELVAVQQAQTDKQETQPNPQEPSNQVPDHQEIDSKQPSELENVPATEPIIQQKVDDDEDFGDFKQTEIQEETVVSRYLAKLPDYSFLFLNQLI